MFPKAQPDRGWSGNAAAVTAGPEDLDELAASVAASFQHFLLEIGEFIRWPLCARHSRFAEAVQNPSGAAEWRCLPAGGHVLSRIGALDAGR